MRIFIDLLWFFRQEKGRYFWGIVMMILLNTIIMIPPFAVQEVVDAMASGSMTQSLLWKWCLLIFIIAVISYLFRFFWRYLIFDGANKLAKLLRSRLYDHYLKMSPSFF